MHKYATEMLERESVCNIDLDTEPRNDSAPQNSKSRSDEADRLNFSGLTFPEMLLDNKC